MTKLLTLLTFLEYGNPEHMRHAIREAAKELLRSAALKLPVLGLENAAARSTLVSAYYQL